MLLHEALKDRRIVLGSASPRRRELLAGLGLEFTVEATPLPWPFRNPKDSTVP